MRNISFRNDVLPLKDILYRLALRITTNPEEAKDIVQDTLIKLWNRRESLGEIESIEGFSLTICRNMALDRVRLLKGKSNPLDSGYAEKADNASDPARFRGKVIQGNSRCDGNKRRTGKDKHLPCPSDGEKEN